MTKTNNKEYDLVEKTINYVCPVRGPVSEPFMVKVYRKIGGKAPVQTCH